jgi:methylated-DNA-protein-cysteine methyltransferase-like protein
LTRTSDIEEKILACIESIPPGQVMSYGEVADCAGTRSARQVGKVLSQPHHPVPWHRVVRADGTLAAPRPERQRELLMAEGVRFAGARVDFASRRGSA